MSDLLGVGSRVNHPAFGFGVITRLNIAAYDVCFQTYGMKIVGKDYKDWEVIEALPAEEEVTFTVAELGQVLERPFLCLINGKVVR